MNVLTGSFRTVIPKLALSTSRRVHPVLAPNLKQFLSSPRNWLGKPSTSVPKVASVTGESL